MRDGGSTEDDSNSLASQEAQVEALRRENAQLRAALETRPVIHQARGVLMAVGACGPGHAWQVLVETSQRTNTKLWRVAEI
ncbi:ANTAR domain-containing protein [Streptomyces sp. NPDC055189]